MFAVLNYYDDPRISEQQHVIKDSLVRSITSDFDLVKDKWYKVVEVNSIDTITVENKLGENLIYSVEWFDK